MFEVFNPTDTLPSSSDKGRIQYSRDSGDRGGRTGRIGFNQEQCEASRAGAAIVSGRLGSEDGARPRKRQRTGMPATFGKRVIEIDDDDRAVNPKTSSPTLPSHMVPQLSNKALHTHPHSMANKQKGKPGIPEYRSVERTVQMTPRRRNSQLKELEESDDELLTRPAREDRKSQNAKPYSEYLGLHKREQEPESRTFSVEVSPRKVEANSLTGQGGDMKLQDAFVQADGKHRNPDLRESPDELQGEKTVGDSWTESSRGGRQLLPCKIHATTFSLRNIPGKTSPERTFAVKRFRLRHVDYTEQGLVLALDKNVSKFTLRTPECLLAKNEPFYIRKAIRILHGDTPSTIIRVKFSGLESPMDIEFSSEKERWDFCNLVQTIVPGVKVIERTK